MRETAAIFFGTPSSLFVLFFYLYVYLYPFTAKSVSFQPKVTKAKA